MKQKIPNYITLLRIFGTLILMFTAPFTGLFYIIYTICGITDVLDGAVARATKTDSEAGAKFDSVADILFYAVMLIKIIPKMWQRVPLKVWYIVGIVLVMRITAYALAAIKYRRFASLHTLLNKVTGLFVFAVPYIIATPFSTHICLLASIVALIAAAEELVIYIKNPDCTERTLGLFWEFCCKKSGK